MVDQKVKTKFSFCFVTMTRPCSLKVIFHSSLTPVALLLTIMTNLPTPVLVMMATWLGLVPEKQIVKYWPISEPHKLTLHLSNQLDCFISALGDLGNRVLSVAEWLICSLWIAQPILVLYSK